MCIVEMEKYLITEKRKNDYQSWITICSVLNSEKTPITLDEEFRIQNDVSDFIEKINENDGEMVILRSQKGTFGFPFETVLQNFKWFTKMVLYDVYLRVPNFTMPKNYNKLEAVEKEKIHKNVIENPRISVNTEHKVHALLTKLAIDKINPHISLLFGATELWENKHEELLQVFIKKYKKSESDFILNACKVLMTEWANLGELSDYIDKNKSNWNRDVWNVMIFQMLAMLALIQEKYPSFRHNDLSLANILVQNTRIVPLDVTEYGGYYKYTINGKTYCVPDIGFRLLLTDFDYATIKELDISNEKINNECTKKFGTVIDQNPSFDCHMMLNWLYYISLELQYFENKHTSIPYNLIELREFLTSTIDECYRGNNNRYLKYGRFRNGKKVIEKLVPKNILENDPYFEKYRNYQDLIQNRVCIEEYNTPLEDNKI